MKFKFLAVITWALFCFVLFGGSYAYFTFDFQNRFDIDSTTTTSLFVIGFPLLTAASALTSQFFWRLSFYKQGLKPVYKEAKPLFFDLSLLGLFIYIAWLVWYVRY